MLLNTALLWVRHYSGYQLSILWPAIPAITGLALSVVGLLKLYPLAANSGPLLAKAGAGFAWLSSISLGVAALWITVLFTIGEGMPQPAPQGLLLLIALFMIAMVLSFTTNMIALLRDFTQRKLGYLLSLPVAMWALMLTVGFIKGMNAGLSLDFYTNAIIGGAFIAIGITLKSGSNTDV